MNDVTAIPGGPNAWGVTGKTAQPVAQEHIRPLDAQGEGWGESMAPGRFTKDDVEKSVEDMNKALSILNRSLKFTVHEDTGKLMVRVIDNESGRIIKEIPPQILLDIEARIEKFLGILFDKKI